MFKTFEDAQSAYNTWQMKADAAGLKTGGVPPYPSSGTIELDPQWVRHFLMGVVVWSRGVTGVEANDMDLAQLESYVEEVGGLDALTPRKPRKPRELRLGRCIAEALNKGGIAASGLAAFLAPQWEEHEVHSVLEEYWPLLAPHRIEDEEVPYSLPSTHDGDTLAVIRVLSVGWTFGTRDKEFGAVRYDVLIGGDPLADGGERLRDVASNLEEAIIVALTYGNDPDHNIERAITLAHHYAVGAGITSNVLTG
ncbi:hypothetical protein LCGC14_2468210 [marine sediment metagenome]|uniref:Uncharacterized protein n=1 Tax=marine sediment metagenome TaxID=412755 RepID=A0A0F9BB42_9ZZZZ